MHDDIDEHALQLDPAVIRRRLALPEASGALALLLTGCIENALQPGDKGLAPGDAPGAESTSAETCDTGDDGGEVEILATCTLPPSDWTLRPRWQLSLEDALMGVSTGRLGDTDGDGLVSGADGVAIWLTKVVHDRDARTAVLLDADGTVLWRDDAWEGARFVETTVGSMGPGEPPCQFITYYASATQSYAAAVCAGKTQYVSDIGDQVVSSWLFLADIEEDGAYELLSVGAAVGARDGAIAYRFGGESWRPVAADLDLDGTSEVLVMDGEAPAVLDLFTGEQVTCPARLACAKCTADAAAFAVGDLDGDPEGEFVVSVAETVAICDADGSLLGQAAVPIAATDTIGLGQLDGDELPEILVGQVLRDASATVVFAFDTDLSPLWTTEIAEGGGHLPFALADLDGDGRHELIARRNTGVSILSPDGVILAELEIASFDASAARNPVVVTDIDGDGRAEILVGGRDPNLVVIDNAAGGWPVRRSQEWWPGVDHFPGDRALDGSLPPESARHWLEEDANVWQGLPAGPPELPDLGVEAQACSGDCVTTLVLASITNHGRAEAPGPVTVDVVRADGTVVVSASVGSIPAGGRVPVELRLPTAEATGELRVRATGRGVECTDVANEVLLGELPCG